MNKNRLFFIFCFCFLAASLLYYGRYNAGAQPGAANDPLVTKNYVDMRVDNLQAQIKNLQTQLSETTGTGFSPPPASGGGLTQAEKDGIIVEALTRVEYIYGGLLEILNEPEPTPEAFQIPFEAVFAENGKVLIADSGTEMILRSGKAVAVSGMNGMVNVTAGTDIVNGMEIPLNHLLIVPASDGRGMRFAMDSWVMVKGVYSFVD